LGGLIWVWLTDPATYRVTARGGYLDERGLAETFNADGWFLVVGVLGGLVLGWVVGLRWRRYGWSLALMLLGAAVLASALTYVVGHALGPGPLGPQLDAAAPAERVSAPLSIQATGVYLGWPVGTMAGLLAAASRRPPRTTRSAKAVDGIRQMVHNHSE
jgi:hypothetical protein